MQGGFHLSAAATRSGYRGWESLKLANDLIEVQVVPNIGGRIIQLKLEDFEYFWVNDQLAGKSPTASGVGDNDTWLNYGGSKLWPAPQGWGDENLWPGPPDAVLDGSPHLGSVITPNGQFASVQVTSQKDKRSGIQFTRRIEIYESTAHVSIDCKMKNIDTKPRRWGIWQVTQHNTANRKHPGYDENVHVYCPINTKSKHPKGYKVIYGPQDNPEFKIDNGMISAKYLHQVGKIGLDCSAGWYALVYETYGYVFVERFDWIPGREYPDDASFELWTQGRGTIKAYGKETKMPDKLEENPYLLETEVLSSFARIHPGESSLFHTDWYVTKIGEHLPVIDCSTAGVTCKRLQVSRSGDRLTIQSGHFGIFELGEAALMFVDADGNEIDRGTARVSVSPKQPLTTEELSKLTESEEIPLNTQQVSLIIMSKSRDTIGHLASTSISR
ncbi:MAG TPA: DUF4380 domain-containing protein [Candidatus Bathyarchaeia archaeon]|nr:DUF4380 domain-containing protein [Candidatus Bathyarchaeia archaeon]